MLRLGADVTVDRNGQEITLTLPDTLLKDRRAIYGRFASVTIDTVLNKELATGDKKTKITNNYGIVEKGDKILSVNGNPVGNFNGLVEIFNENKNEEITLLIERKNKQMPVTVQLDTAGKVGFGPSVEFNDQVKKVPYSWGSAFVFGARDGFTTIYSQVLAFGQMFKGKLPVVENMQSPIGIMKYFGGHWDWFRFWTLTGLISFVLAFMNILPIPALDGGHMMFLTWEMITGKALSDKFLERAQMVGMAILLPLMLLILLKDIYVDWISKLFG